MSPPPPGLVGKTSLLQQLDYLGEITIFLTVTFLKNIHGCIHGYIHGYLILGTWYREPFCHQMGPYQTLRAESWCTQLLVRFRVFF